MFQYAAAKSLAIHKNIYLKIDKDYNQYRKYELDAFKISSKIANKRETRFYSNKYILFILLKLNKKILKKVFNIYLEPVDGYNADFFNLPDDCYLIGHFQNENYFKDIRNIILKEFEFKNKVDDKLTIAILSKLNPISIHVRRGDYINNKHNAVFNVCDVNYYHKAIDLICEKVKTPYFYIFSEDIAWCKENLKIKQPHLFIEYNEKNTIRDLLLMSFCKHNIIANSTYSWWGAWLNKNKSKIIIAPKKWLNSDPKYYKNIVPSNWIKI